MGQFMCVVTMECGNGILQPQNNEECECAVGTNCKYVLMNATMMYQLGHCVGLESFVFAISTRKLLAKTSCHAQK